LDIVEKDNQKMKKVIGVAVAVGVGVE